MTVDELAESEKFPLLSKHLFNLKANRKHQDGKKKNFTPFYLNSGRIEFVLARHFGFCFGVERAVGIAYEALNRNKGEKVFLLSEMIHNPDVNEDLKRRGVIFLLDTLGNELHPIEHLNAGDVVILPAFGVSLEMEKQLRERGVDVEQYDTTCPFVERVWKRARQLGESGYSIVVHGKPAHEETRATFSRAAAYAPTLVIRSIDEAGILSSFIKGQLTLSEFWRIFEGRASSGFDPANHLMRIGVINQTTMLAEETAELASIIRAALIERGGEEVSSCVSDIFADTRDTLCYATSENQSSVHALLKEEAHVAIVIGGFNSSNTTHLAAICERSFPTFHIRGPDDILALDLVKCRDVSSGVEIFKSLIEYLPKDPTSSIRVALTAGASTPDAIVEAVMEKFEAAIQDPL
jgi:4-hydroxy-3-methylbut-2-enyl diphosphate reductase